MLVYRFIILMSIAGFCNIHNANHWAIVFMLIAVVSLGYKMVKDIIMDEINKDNYGNKNRNREEI